MIRWRRPHKVVFPGGYRVPISYWSNRRVRAEMRKDPSLGKNDLLGYWDGQRIVINSSEPKWIQIRTLGHELIHAVNDYSHWLVETVVGPMEREAGETAMHMADDLEELEGK